VSQIHELDPSIECAVYFGNTRIHKASPAARTSRRCVGASPEEILLLNVPEGASLNSVRETQDKFLEELMRGESTCSQSEFSENCEREYGLENL
jgi:hypothetical protein